MLENIYVLKIKIELLSGLYIGGNESGFDIGGADSNVIKNPLTKEPYIPGSSLKGKLRSLLTHKYGTISGNTMIINDPVIKNIFEPVKNDETVQVSRAIFRDAFLTKESSKQLQDILGPRCFTEIKAENKINALSGTADSPRFIERVPAGAIFEGEIVLNVFEGDDQDKMKKIIKESLKGLELSYLGGSGTRGYGRVKVDFDDFEKVG